MLYLEDETLKSWKKVALFLGSRQDLEMVALLYPGRQTAPSPFLPAVCHEDLEPVTTWVQTAATASARVAVDASLLDTLAAVPVDDLQECDLALYPVQKREWVACAVPHEGAIIIRDDDVCEALRALGLMVSVLGPEGW